MNFFELVKRIEQCMDGLDLVSARRYIEDNMDILMENKNHLRGNVRELVDMLYTMPEQKASSLNSQEISIIKSLNAYAAEFDLRSVKLSVKNNAELFMREEVKEYLSSDAKLLLQGMSALS